MKDIEDTVEYHTCARELRNKHFESDFVIAPEGRSSGEESGNLHEMCC